MRSWRIPAILIWITLAALACNLGTGSESPPEPAAEGRTNGDSDASEVTGDGSAPDPEGEAEMYPTSVDLDDPSLYVQPENLTSYRTSMELIFMGPGPVTGTISMESATLVDPPANQISLIPAGRAMSGKEIAIFLTEIQDSQYLVFEGFDCQFTQTGVGGGSIDVPLDAGGVLTGRVDLAGEEIVNGVRSYRYDLTLENIDPLAAAGMEFDSIEEGKLYLSQDTMTAVRIILAGMGVNELLSQDPNLVGDVYYEINYYDFDQPFEIDVPQECQAVGDAGSKFPVPDDASDINPVSDYILTFQTGRTVDDMIGFFQEEMPALGCAEPQVEGGSSIGTATMSFDSCQGGHVDIIIVSQSSEVTQVNILQTP